MVSTTTVNVTKPVSVRTTPVAYRRLYIVRRFHPEMCHLTPPQVVELNALGPYCDSPRGWQPRGWSTFNVPLTRYWWR